MGCATLSRWIAQHKKINAFSKIEFSHQPLGRSWPNLKRMTESKMATNTRWPPKEYGCQKKMAANRRWLPIKDGKETRLIYNDVKTISCYFFSFLLQFLLVIFLGQNFFWVTKICIKKNLGQTKNLGEKIWVEFFFGSNKIWVGILFWSKKN